jgi:hypothetical protein
MPRFLVELAMLTRSTTLCVVETDYRPDRADMREVYDMHDDPPEWHDDPNWSEEGTHQVIGEVVDGNVEGFGEVAALPVITLHKEDDDG